MRFAIFFLVLACAGLCIADIIPYRLEVKTKDRLFAGTDAYVDFNIEGVNEDGKVIKTGWRSIDGEGGKFERNSRDFVTIYGDDVKNVKNIRIRIHGMGFADGWTLDYVRFTHNNHRYTGSFKRSFDDNWYRYYPRSFTMSCSYGYKQSSYFGFNICVDIDECKLSCQETGENCTNFVGGYTCGCKPGYLKVNDRCEDIDECAFDKNSCLETPNTYCINSLGSYSCHCESGFERNTGGVCEDVDECAKEKDNKCHHSCENTQGGFKCTCKKGFHLGTDKRTCLDTNECADSNKCDNVTSVCYDSGPSFICLCKPGYEPSKTEKNKCVPVRCIPLKSLAKHVNTDPPECYTDGLSYKEKCYFKCSPGYELGQTSAKYYVCNEHGAWSGSSFPACIPQMCPSVTLSKGVKVDPTECETRGVSQGKTCYFYCDNEYKLIGEREIMCDRQNYTADTNVQCVHQPYIKCPMDQNKDLPHDKSTVALGNNYKYYDTNADAEMVWSLPKDVGPLYQFPVGETKVTYFVRNELNETKSCSFMVTISDVSKPTVVYCPTDLYIETKEAYVNMTWKEPIFRDNTGVVRLESRLENGKQREASSEKVSYVAHDAYRNFEFCNFKINVKRLRCTFDSFLGADQHLKSICTPISLQSANCHVECPEGKTLDVAKTSFPIVGLFFCLKASVNGKDNIFPSCVDYEEMKNGTCSPGWMPTYTMKTAQPVCGKCARGTYFDSITKKCTSCPLHTYQDKEGQLNCLKCPQHTGTFTVRTIHKENCTEKCDLGTKSLTGLKGTRHNKCKPCLDNMYSDGRGAKECKPCPFGYTTEGDNKGTLSDCLGKPETEMEKYNVTTVYTEFGIVLKSNDVETTTKIIIECVSKGSPLPSVTIHLENKRKASFAKHALTNHSKKIFQSNGTVTVVYAITDPTAKDMGAYTCRAINKKGNNTACLKIFQSESDKKFRFTPCRLE